MVSRGLQDYENILQPQFSAAQTIDLTENQKTLDQRISEISLDDPDVDLDLELADAALNADAPTVAEPENVITEPGELDEMDLSPDDILELAKNNPSISILQSMQGSLGDSVRHITGFTDTTLNKAIGAARAALNDLEPEDPTRAVVQTYIKQLQDAKKSNAGDMGLNKDASRASQGLERTTTRELADGRTVTHTVTTNTPRALVTSVISGALSMQIGRTGANMEDIYRDFREVPGLFEETLKRLEANGELDARGVRVSQMLRNDATGFPSNIQRTLAILEFEKLEGPAFKPLHAENNLRGPVNAPGLS